MNRRVNWRIIATTNVTIDSDSFLNFMRTVNLKRLKSRNLRQKFKLLIQIRYRPVKWNQFESKNPLKIYHCFRNLDI